MPWLRYIELMREFRDVVYPLLKRAELPSWSVQS
jgi:hypothetical protein